jgi:hypothetical protein
MELTDVMLFAKRKHVKLFSNGVKIAMLRSLKTKKSR